MHPITLHVSNLRLQLARHATHFDPHKRFPDNRAAELVCVILKRVDKNVSTEMPMKTRASSRKVVKFKYAYSMCAPRYALCVISLVVLCSQCVIAESYNCIESLT